MPVTNISYVSYPTYVLHTYLRVNIQGLSGLTSCFTTRTQPEVCKSGLKTGKSGHMVLKIPTYDQMETGRKRPPKVS